MIVLCYGGDVASHLSVASDAVDNPLFCLRVNCPDADFGRREFSLRDREVCRISKCFVLAKLVAWQEIGGALWEESFSLRTHLFCSVALQTLVSSSWAQQVGFFGTATYDWH